MKELYTELAPGMVISKIITGLWQIADMERNGNTLDATNTAEHLKAYSDSGLNTFDIADHYGSSEIIAGVFKNTIEPKAMLFTKWVPKPGRISKDDVRSAIETSLERMQQRSLDLLQFHAWHYPDPSWLDSLFYLSELREEGLIKHIGVTNMDAAHFKMALASGIPLISNQVCYSLIDQRASGGLNQICEEYSVKLLAYGTLAGGFLTERWLGKPEPGIESLSTWSEMKYKRFIDAAGGWAPFQELLKGVKAVADKYNATMANIATNYVLQDPNVAGVIVGARPGVNAHIEDNLNMLNIQLDNDDITLIQSKQHGLTPIPGDCGDEYRKEPFLTASGDLSHHLETIPPVFEVKNSGKDRSQVFSGTSWEPLAGYCRAFREGNRIHVSGTTATHGEKLIGGNDAASQTHFVIDKLEAAIESLGGKLEDVVRTRIFVSNVNNWEPVARAHGERFRNIQPANTLVEARLVGEGYLVEIEADAVVPD